MRLQNKVAIITGATSGIGLATAEVFVKEGAHVILIGRSKEGLQKLQSKFAEKALVISADVNQVDDLNRVKKEIELKFGDKSIDIFFANAGIAYSTPLGQTDDERYMMLMNTNVKSVFNSMQTFLPFLREGASVILNSAWLNKVGMPGFSILSASKAAVRSFARTWSAELLDKKIRVNCVTPGAVDTPIFELEGTDTLEIEKTKKKLSSLIPSGRMASTTDIANAVLFLASNESNYMLGGEIVVDGGFSEL